MSEYTRGPWKIDDSEFPAIGNVLDLNGNQIWPTLAEIKTNPYKIDDGNLLCYGVDIVTDDCGCKKNKTLHFVSLKKALSLTIGQEIRY